MCSRPIANTDQASSWDGPEGDYWRKNEARYNRMLRVYSERLLAAARIQSGERVLDVGCGCGDSSCAAARAASPGAVLGGDLSAGMLARARERAAAEGLRNLSFEQADAQVHPFAAEAFDVILSRFGVMFFADPLAAFRNLGRALPRDGRITLLTWRGAQHNEWIREIRGTLAGGPPKVPPSGAPGPLDLSEPESVKPILSNAGFGEIAFTETSERLRYGETAGEAFDFIRGTPLVEDVLSEMDPPARMRALDALRALLERHQSAEGVCFQSSAWIVTARRRAR
jgi:SAM-dependent methyltransferase